MVFRLKIFLMTFILTIQVLMGCDSYKWNTYCSKGNDFKACEDGTIWRSKRNERCYRKEYLCDGIVDCSDGSDEKYCKYNYNYGKFGFSYRFIKGNCPDKQFLCKSSSIIKSGKWMEEKCFHENEICDGKKQCIDGSDELYCPYNVTTGFNFFFERDDCPPGLFRCQTSSSGRKCIQRAWICDDHTDCDDASDENFCPHIFPNDPHNYERITSIPTAPTNYSENITTDNPFWHSNDFSITEQPIVSYILANVLPVCLVTVIILIMYKFCCSIKKRYIYSPKLYNDFQPDHEPTFNQIVE